MFPGNRLRIVTLTELVKLGVAAEVFQQLPDGVTILLEDGVESTNHVPQVLIAQKYYAQRQNRGIVPLHLYRTGVIGCGFTPKYFR